MKKELIVPIIIAILVICAGAFLYLWIQTKKDLEVQRAITSQNELAFNSKLETITNEKGTLYKKLAFVEDINQKLKNDSTSLALLTKNQKEKILSLVVAKTQLEKFRDSVIAVQNFEIPPNLIGKTLFFKNDPTKQSFFNYEEIVTLGNKSTNNITITGTPFSINVATARDKEGRVSGILEFEPSWINKYLKVLNVNVSMEKDEFSKYTTFDNPFSLSILPSAGIVAMPELYFSYGGGVLINKKHLIEYQTILGKTFHMIKYSYNIQIW